MIFPPIPTRVEYLGDQDKARRLLGIGRQRLAFLSDQMGYMDQQTGKNTLRFKDGAVIETTFNYALSTIRIYVPVGVSRKEIERELCACCGDCLLIGEIISDPVFSDYQTIIDVKVCQQGGDGYASVELYNIYFEDGNHTFVIGDKCLLFIRPTLKSSGIIARESDLQTAQKNQNLWQIFNCMSRSGIKDSEDLTDNGIDTNAFTISDDSCKHAKDAIPLDTTEYPETVMPSILALSFKMTNCFKA